VRKKKKENGWRLWPSCINASHVCVSRFRLDRCTSTPASDLIRIGAGRNRRPLDRCWRSQLAALVFRHPACCTAARLLRDGRDGLFFASVGNCSEHRRRRKLPIVLQVLPNRIAVRARMGENLELRGHCRFHFFRYNSRILFIYDGSKSEDRTPSLTLCPGLRSHDAVCV